MILSFKTKINDKPTFFVEKIHSGLLQNGVTDFDGISFENGNFDVQKLTSSEPKLHTIRTDEKNRWKTGVLIDFFINARQKNMFRFAPRIPVISTQFIGIYHLEKSIEIAVDGVYLFPSEIEELALNDGFENVEDFFNYFNEDFHGKIIHWTDIIY